MPATLPHLLDLWSDCHLSVREYSYTATKRHSLSRLDYLFTLVIQGVRLVNTSFLPQGISGHSALMIILYMKTPTVGGGLEARPLALVGLEY